jgi:hypothetical protein
MTETELSVIRGHYYESRKQAFLKNPLRTKARVWVTYDEVMEFNEYREQRSLCLVQLSKGKQADPEYQIDRDWLQPGMMRWRT